MGTLLFVGIHSERHQNIKMKFCVAVLLLATVAYVHAQDILPEPEEEFSVDPPLDQELEETENSVPTESLVEQEVQGKKYIYGGKFMSYTPTYTKYWVQATGGKIYVWDAHWKYAGGGSIEGGITSSTPKIGDSLWGGATILKVINNYKSTMIVWKNGVLWYCPQPVDTGKHISCTNYQKSANMGTGLTTCKYKSTTYTCTNTAGTQKGVLKRESYGEMLEMWGVQAWPTTGSSRTQSLYWSNGIIFLKQRNEEVEPEDTAFEMAMAFKNAELDTRLPAALYRRMEIENSVATESTESLVEQEVQGKKYIYGGKFMSYTPSYTKYWVQATGGKIYVWDAHWKYAGGGSIEGGITSSTP